MTIHIIGGGLAGLSAAVALTKAGHPIVLYESGPQAGGRCRSYDDRELGCRVDNGNHLLLSGNTAALDYLATVGARDTLGGPGAPFFPFMDLASGKRWTLRPSAGRLPLWVFSPIRRVPGTKALDYLRLLPLARANGAATIDDLLPPGALRRNLLEPLAISALNTPPQQARAALMAAVMRETLTRGGSACIPLFPAGSLSETLIDPALRWLQGRGATIHLGRRIADLSVADGRVVGLGTTAGAVALAAHDAVILATPPWVATDLLPGLVAPDSFQAIMNLHFAVAPAAPPADIARAGFVGLVGGTSEWVFLKPGHVSVTISAANRFLDTPPEELAATVWPEVCKALGLVSDMPRCRVVKEKRATFAATPVQDSRRPGARTAIRNLFLAGDWTSTGLPATIEGAIRSGRTAADMIRAAL
ncbi:MAG TPA: hydroxysqualene dehydroxylase HpnE [Acidisphaera sp.]|nr:hydroxysqualene dehydroxylase HpnE [Acidisphaera sp.]